MANHNMQRLSEDVKREISSGIHELKDARVANGIVSVTACEVTSDLSYCKVYVSVLGGGEKTKEACECLKGAAGFFKRRINARIKMRKLPELIFLPDNSQEYYEKISGIIDSLPKRAETPENDDTDKGNGEEDDR